MTGIVLVTGCAGFIGSNLVDALLTKGFNVLGVDHFDDYYSRAIKERNMADALRCTSFKFVEADVRNEAALKEIVKEDDVRFVCHLAARAGVRASIKSPSIYNDINVTGTLSLLKACLDSNVEKLVYASSSSVYGNIESLPTSEDVLPKPISPYGASKLAAEAYCLCFERTYGLGTLVLRYFTVYGPRQRPDEAISSFLNAAMRKEPVTVYGDGNQERDFTYVSDTVDGTIAAMKSNLSGEIFNIGSGRRASVNQLLGILEEVCRTKITRVYTGRQEGDVLVTWADIRKAVDKIGFEPRITLREGLQRYYKWCIAHQKAMEP